MTNRMVVFDEESEPARTTVELPPDMLIFDVDAAAILQQLSETEFLVFDAPPVEVQVITAPSDFLLVDSARTTSAIDQDTGDDVLVISTQGVTGPAGPPGVSPEPYEYQMPVAQTTTLVTHPLGYDPVAVQVVVGGEVCSEYSVVVTIPDQQVRIAFDVAVQALIRLM